MVNLQALYQNVGRAIHKAQIVEFNLVTLMILLDKIEPSGDKTQNASVWDKKTLGRLLDPIIKSGVISDDVKLFLETLIGARNHLAHSFFMTDKSISNTQGVSKLIREVNAMIDVFDRAISLFDEVIQIFSVEYGIDYLEIKEKSRSVVLSDLN